MTPKQRQEFLGAMRARLYPPPTGNLTLTPGGVNYVPFGQPSSPAEPAPDPSSNDIYGFRYWIWDGVLHSPHTGTDWETPELQADHWAGGDGMFQCDTSWGTHGIHAAIYRDGWEEHRDRVTNTQIEVAGVWRDLTSTWVPWGSGRHGGANPRYITGTTVRGVVERFGKYVLGAYGWRAEWAIIKCLYSPREDVCEALERKYPDVKVITKGETWTLDQLKK